MKKSFLASCLLIFSFSSFAYEGFDISNLQKTFNIRYNKDSSVIILNNNLNDLLSEDEKKSLQNSQYIIINSISSLMNIFKTMQFLDQTAYRKDIFIVDKKHLLELVETNYNTLFYNYANAIYIEKNRIPDAFTKTIYNATKAQVTLDNLNKNLRGDLIFGDILETQNSIMIKIAYLIKDDKKPDEIKKFIDSQKNNYTLSYFKMAEDLKNKYILMEQAKRMLSQ